MVLKKSPPESLLLCREDPKYVVICSGGVTGLSVTYYFQKKTREAKLGMRFTLLEKSSRPGGKIVTEQAGPFLVDGYPGCFVTHKPWLLEY